MPPSPAKARTRSSGSSTARAMGAFKPAVGEAVVETLRPIREEAEPHPGDKAYLESVYKQGAEKASYVANKTLRKVYKKVGFRGPLTGVRLLPKSAKKGAAFSMTFNGSFALQVVGSAVSAALALVLAAGGGLHATTRWSAPWPSRSARWMCPRTTAGCTTTPSPGWAAWPSSSALSSAPCSLSP